MSNKAKLEIEVTSDSAGAAKELDASAGKVSRWGGTMEKAALPAAAALAAVSAVAVKAANAAAEDAQSQAILAQAMKNTTGASKSQVASMEAWISKTAAATGVADDQLRPALGALVRATKDVSKSQEAMGLALDIAAATGKSVESVSAALAKGYGGQTTALGKLVPGIDKAVLASKDMDKITAELARTTGGSAAAAANTAAGKMQRFKLSMDETMEAAGGALLPIMDKLSGLLLQVATWAQKNSTVFVILAGVIAGLAVAVLAINAAFKVYAAVTKVVAAVTWLMNTALWASPITWIVVGVIALVAALVLLYRNSEAVREAIDKVWSVMKTGAAAAWSAVKTAFDAILNAIKSVFTWVKGNWPLLLAILTGPIGLAVLAITKNWDKIKAAAQTLLSWITGAFAGAFEAVKGAATRAFNPIVTIVNSVKSAIDRVVDAVESLIGWLGRIKVPKISLPSIPGFGRSAPSASTAAPVAGVPSFTAATSSAAGLSRSSRSTGGARINITVNGAIDPEATARQIRRILEGHSRRVGLAS